MKTRPLGAEVLTCWQTEMTTLRVAYHNFANMPKTTRPSQSSFPCF